MHNLGIKELPTIILIMVQLLSNVSSASRPAQYSTFYLYSVHVMTKFTCMCEYYLHLAIVFRNWITKEISVATRPLWGARIAYINKAALPTSTERTGDPHLYVTREVHPNAPP